MEQSKRLAVLDLETDPFEYGAVPEPFLSGYYDGCRFITIWNERDCIERTVAMLAKEKPTIIYAHNGGKFDWYYFLQHFNAQSSLRIINGRIIQAFLGEHEIRDSFAIMPFALKKYKKDDIDYQKLRRGVRAKHKDEIISYLRGDCVYLYELIQKYWAEFGDVLTIGSASMRELKKFHTFTSHNSHEFDAKFREPYYYGGRVQVFRPGVIEEDLQVYDVNSMYPYVMKAYAHPVSVKHAVSRSIEKDTCFVTAEGESFGAFPVRDKNGIHFPNAKGVFHCSIHEWHAAEETRSFRPARILKTYGFQTGSFDTFVNHFYTEREKAKAANDKARDLFYKFVLNSGYGKFAQNSANFYEWHVTGMDVMSEPWEMAAMCPGKYILWRKPVSEFRFYNIATAASITGAARAVLLKGLYGCDRPAYCDTDSIIAHSASGLEIDAGNLGAWKLEASATLGAFAGKKLYALFDANGKCVKKACKGVSIEGHEILRVANGEEIVTQNPAPHFSLDGGYGFIQRKVKRTV